MFLPSNVNLNRGSVNKITLWIKKEITLRINNFNNSINNNNNNSNKVDNFSSELKMILQDIDKYIQIIVLEVQCNEPNCVPIETLIILLYTSYNIMKITGDYMDVNNKSVNNDNDNNFNERNISDNKTGNFIQNPLVDSTMKDQKPLKWSTKIMKPIIEVMVDDIQRLDLPMHWILCDNVKDDVKIINNDDDYNNIGNDSSLDDDVDVPEDKKQSYNNVDNAAIDNTDSYDNTLTGDKSTISIGGSSSSSSSNSSSIGEMITITRVQMKPISNISSTTTTSNNSINNNSIISQSKNTLSATQTFYTDNTFNHSTVRVVDHRTSTNNTSKEVVQQEKLEQQHQQQKQQLTIQLNSNVDETISYAIPSITTTIPSITSTIPSITTTIPSRTSTASSYRSKRNTLSSSSSLNSGTIAPRHTKGSTRPRGCPCCDPDNLDNIIDTYITANIPHH